MNALHLKSMAAGIAGALALLAGAPAMASNIGFETNGLNIYTGGDQFEESGFTMTVLDSVSSPGGGLSGMIIDGANPFSCDIIACPGGNSSYYYAGLNDGGLKVERSNAKGFQIGGLDYAFVAPIGGLQNFNYGQLTLVGQLQGGGTVQTSFDFPMQDAGGNYNFSAKTLAPAFSGATLSSLTISACLFGSDKMCYNPAANQAQFAIDNLNVMAVPEPETYAMLLGGLGIMAMLSRRRSAKSANATNA